MMGKILALDLKPKGIALVCIHPGFLKTDMTAHYSHFYEEFGAMCASDAVGPILMAVKRVFFIFYKHHFIYVLSIVVLCISWILMMFRAGLSLPWALGGLVLVSTLCRILSWKILVNFLGKSFYTRQF